jgi:hypothetical protein
LNAHQYNELLKRVAKDLQDYGVRVATTPDRHQRIEAMEAWLSSLKAVSESVEHHKRVLEPLLVSDILPVLGKLMSPSGLVQLGRTGPGAWGLGELELSSPGFGPIRDNARGRDSARSLDPVHIDELTAIPRVQLAKQVGPRLLIALLESLKAPVELMLEFERRSRGGRPADVERNYVIEELATFFREMTGQTAPTGKSGPFFDLCHETLTTLGLSTEGLDSRIRRVLRPRPTPSRARQNPS